MNVAACQYRKEVRPDDLHNVRRIVESSGFFSTAEVKIAVELVHERLTKGTQSGYNFLFLEREGEVIGYSCFGRIPCTEASYDVYWIAVHDSCRGKGVGKKLLTETETEIVQQGGERIYVDTSSREQYEPTRRFYLACGYREEAVLDDFYAPGDAKVIYVKEITCSQRHGFAEKAATT